MMLGGICGTTVEMDSNELGETLDMQQQTLHLLEHPMGAMGGGTAWADLGVCALEAGQLASARQMFQQGLTTHTLFMYLSRPRFLIGMAQVELAEGDAATAWQHVTAARAFVDERKMQWCDPLVAMAEAKVEAARNRPEPALERYRSAQRAANAMGLRALDAQAQAGAERLEAPQ